jgi:hypothetical protein
VPAATILVGLTALVGFMALPADADLWFHLADGDYILAHGRVPQTDPFSFTRVGELWVPHSWLFDVGVTLAWNKLGPRAAEAIMAGVFVLCVLLSFGLLTARRVPVLVALVVCAALAVGAGNTRGLRPQVFSLLFTNLVIVLLVLHRQRPGRRILVALPPLFLLWAQVHGACIMGLVVGVIWLAGRVFDTVIHRTWSEHRREIVMLAAAITLAALAVLITPHAITHYRYVALTTGLEFLRTRVSEWQSPRALSLTVPDVYHFLLCAGVLVVLARSARRVGWAEVGVAGALILLGFSATRHIPLACIGCVPLLADALGRSDVVDVARWRIRLQAPAAPAVVMLVVLVGLWRFPTDVDTRYAQAEPVAGARALRELEAPMRVFTSYNTGAYILWAGPTELRVFVDSRADVYGDALLVEADLARQGRGWQTLFELWAIDAAVVERHDPLAEILAGRDDWVALAEDHDELTFLRRDLSTAITSR